VEGNPLLSGSLKLSNGSPAIGTGAMSDVYAEYLFLFGEPIQQDFAELFRPTNGTWDMGAFEFFGGLIAPTVNANTLNIND
jgi:hypothetical protein